VKRRGEVVKEDPTAGDRGSLRYNLLQRDRWGAQALGRRAGPLWDALLWLWVDGIPCGDLLRCWGYRPPGWRKGYSMSFRTTPACWSCSRWAAHLVLGGGKLVRVAVVGLMLCWEGKAEVAIVCDW